MVTRGGLESFVHMIRALSPHATEDLANAPDVARLLASPDVAWLLPVLRARLAMSAGALSEEVGLISATADLDSRRLFELVLELLTAAAAVAADCYAPAHVRAAQLPPQALALLNEVRLAGLGPEVAAPPLPWQEEYDPAWLPPRIRDAFVPLRHAWMRWARDTLNAQRFARLEPILEWWLFEALAVYGDAYEPMTFATIDAEGHPRPGTSPWDAPPRRP